MEVVISTASDKDGGGDTLRCAAHGTDIINHDPCRLCGNNTCPDCEHPAHPIPLFRTSNDCAVGCSQCSLASWSNEALERLLDDILAERAAAK